MPPPFLELTADEFLDSIAAAEPGPGGGAVAALTLAHAAALVKMAAQRSRDSWKEAPGAAAQAQALRRRAAQLVDPAAEVWVDALEALKVPADDLEAKLRRSIEIPLEIGALAADVAALASLVARRGDGTYRSDVACAAVLAEAAARAAEKLVNVNLSLSRVDERRDRAQSSFQAARAAATRALESGP
jgi:formiminotetrahydrofolate cyclodeaminase